MANCSASDEAAVTISKQLSTLYNQCTDSLAENPGDEYLTRCKECCEKLQAELTSQRCLHDTNTSLLQGFSKAMLDFTFFIENQLVDEEFPVSNAEDRVQKLLDSFNIPLGLAKEHGCTKSVDVLGPDTLECLLWRKGALLYMYCSTIQEDQERLVKQKQEFLKHLRYGVEQLQAMLTVRTKLEMKHKDIITKSEETFQLLQKGIYSDTHLLGLMYAGEMCYWHVKHQDPQQDNTQFNARETGRKILNLYIDTVKEYMTGRGWNCDRAEQLLAEIV